MGIAAARAFRAQEDRICVSDAPVRRHVSVDPSVRRLSTLNADNAQAAGPPASLTEARTVADQPVIGRPQDTRRGYHLTDNGSRGIHPRNAGDPGARVGPVGRAHAAEVCPKWEEARDGNMGPVPGELAAPGQSEQPSRSRSTPPPAHSLRIGNLGSQFCLRAALHHYAAGQVLRVG